MSMRHGSVARTARWSSPQRGVAVALATLLVLGACGHDLPIDEGASPTFTEQTTSTPGAVRQDIDAREFLEVIAAAGVSIVDPNGEVVVAAKEPAGPVKLTEWQAAALAREAALGVGIAAGDLDALIGEPIPDAPLSTILAGYLIAADTPGGDWAADLIGPLDLEMAAQVEYPAAVLLLFVAELMRPGPTEAAGYSAAAVVPAAFRTTRSDQPLMLAPFAQVPVPDVGCGLLAGQVGAMLEQIFTDLALNPPIPLPDWLVAAGLSIVKTHLIMEWSNFVPATAAALTVLLTVSLVTAVVGSWSMQISPSNSSDRFSVGAEAPRPQSFTADVAGSPAWPPGLDECATTAGVTLPDPTGSGTEVTWAVTGIPQYGDEDARENSFDAKGTARLDWHTGHEDSDAGQPQTGTVSATVQPDPAFRQGLLDAATAALEQLLNGSGPLLKASSGVLPEASSIMDTAAKLIAQNASASVEVLYHTEDCLTGTWVSVAYRAADQETMGGAGTVTMVLSDPATGSVTFDPAAPVFSRVGPDDPWVMMELDGSYTFTLNATGRLVHTEGDAYLTPYVDLGGSWIQTSGGPLLITQGGMGSMAASTFVCSGGTLIVSSPYSEFEFGKTD